MDERRDHRVGQRAQAAEVAVVALSLTRQHRVQCVVHVVGPLPGEPVAAGFTGADQPRVVEVGLGDQEQRPVDERGESVDLDDQLLEQMCRAGVDDLVDCVET